jgi:hypothetical protein
MATPIPDGHWLAKLRWRLTGDNEEMVSTIALRGAEPGERPPDEVAHAVFMAWHGAFEPSNMNNAWSFVGVDVIVGGGAEGNDVGTWNEIIPGTMPNASLPQNCAMLVKKKTPRAGRRNSGRMYIPSAYMAEADVSATGQIATASLNAYNSWVSNFFTSLRDTGQPVGQPPTSFLVMLLHSEPPGGGAAPVPTEVTSLTVDPVIATMRKRLRR